MNAYISDTSAAHPTLAHSIQDTAGCGTTRLGSLEYQSPITSPPACLSEPPEAPKGGPLIMIVDDEPIVHTALGILLRSRGYRILEANDGLEAVQLYNSYRKEIALVITDMVMPQLDGPELVRTLKRVDPSLNIIGHSGTVMAGSRYASCASQLFAFLPKPCPNAIILQAVADAVANRPQTGSWKACNLV